MSGSYGSCSPGQSNSENRIAQQLFCVRNVNDTDLKQLWDIELEPELKVEDPILQKFNDSIQFHDDRYEVSLPWKLAEKGPKPVNNYNSVLQQQKSLSKRLEKQPELKCMYNKGLARNGRGWSC